MSIPDVVRELAGLLVQYGDTFHCKTNKEEYEFGKKRVLNARRRLFDLLTRVENKEEWQLQLLRERESSFIDSTSDRIRVYYLLCNALQ